MSTEPVTITIDDPLIDAPAAPEPEAPPAQPPASVPAAPAAEEKQTEGAERLAALQAQYEAAQRENQRLADERNRAALYAQEQTRLAILSQNDALLSRYNEFTSALAANRREMNNLKAAYKAAFQEGDAERCAEIHASMAEIGPRINDLENGKAAIERQAERQKREAAARTNQPPQQQPAADPFEASIAGLSEPSRRWMRQNKAFVSTGDNMNDVVAAHHYVTRRLSLAPDTPEYFQAVEEELGLRQPISPAQPRRSLPAAPVSRAAPNAQLRPNQVSLTPEEQAMARDLDMTNEEYAKGKQYIAARNRNSQHARMN